MSFSRRYALTILLPPFAFALPLALLFLTHVARLSDGTSLRVALVAVAAYAVAGFVAAGALSRAAREVEDDLEAKRDPSASLSSVLERTSVIGMLLWVGWGLVLALAGAASVARTFLGLQYFGEAALIVAAPAMAWAYWVGKRTLVRSAAGVSHLEYRGRVWSVGAKIGIVFIGFFFVSSGALILVISSRVAAELGDQAAYSIERFGLLIAVVTSLVFAAATWFLAQDIIVPLNQMVGLAGEMARGRFDSEPRIFADDEVGKVVGSFGATQRNIRALLARIGDAGAGVTGGVREMTSGTETLVENARAQAEMAEESRASLTLVQNEAEGVVSHAEQVSRLSAESASAATQLRASFESVARQMDDLFHSVEKSSSAATQINASARETVGSTSALATIGNDVLTFVAEMEATVSQIMQTAQSTAGISQQVRQDALAGSSAVDATVAGIRSVQQSTHRTAGTFEALQKSLGQIDQILLFIDDVTNRTNLLSLNAAIIAAQAGANDFGFSVIADEVRQLADRTRTATKEIAQIIRNVQPVAREAVEALEEGARDVDQTVHLAQEAAGSLATILASADRSLDMTRSISSALSDQAKASGYLHDVTSRMSESIAEMRRATEGQAEATRMLAVEAERVSGIALRVKRATEEQTQGSDAIALAMEQIAEGVAATRDRLQRQLLQAEQAAEASQQTLRIAERNSEIAERFRSSLQALLDSGREFEAEVARYQK